MFRSNVNNVTDVGLEGKQKETKNRALRDTKKNVEVLRGVGIKMH